MFAETDLDTLLGELEEPDAEAFRAVSEALGCRSGWSSSLAWQGLPWRWALVYSAKGVGEPGLAYQIPDPRGSRICIPVPVAGPGAPDLASLTKPVRKVIEHAAIIAGYLWPEWPSTEFDAVALASLLEARTSNTGD